MKDWAKEIVEDAIQPKMKAGKIMQHPDGRKIKITGGQLWGTYGLSNFWYWREILENDKLGEEECGYGWC